MFNDQLSLLAAALASSSAAPVSQDASIADLLLQGSGSALQTRQAQQPRPRRNTDPEWQAREAADTLLAAAAEMHRPAGTMSRPQQQLQQLLARQVLQGKQASRQPQRGPLAPPVQQNQLDGMLAALSGEVADEDLENVAQALLVSYPDLSKQLLQIQPQAPRQSMQQQQLQQQQDQLIASLLSDQQRQQPSIVQQAEPSNQHLIEQLVRGLMQPEPDQVDVQLLQQAAQLPPLLAAHQARARPLQQQQQPQLQRKQQEQDVWLQFAMQQQQQQQQQQQTQQPSAQRPQLGLLQQLQQQHAQQRLQQQQQQQQQTESLKSGSAVSEMDADAAYGLMAGGKAAAAAATADLLPVSGSGRPNLTAGKGKRRSGGTPVAGLLPPMSPMSPATAAALAPPPEALAALAAAGQPHASAASSSQLQQQQLGLPQASARTPPQDVYTLAAAMQPPAGGVKPPAALAAAAAAGLPDGSSSLAMLQQQQQQSQPHQQQPNMLGGRLANLLGASSSGLPTPSHQPYTHAGAGAAGIGGGEGSGDDGDGDDGDDDELLPPPGLGNLQMPPLSSAPADLLRSEPQAAPQTGPMSLRAKLGLPPVGLSGPHSAALPGTGGEVGPLVRPVVTLNHHVVFVWDFDETLVPLHSLITGQYASLTGAVEAPHASALGRQLQGMVLQLADEAMHFKELEDVDTVNVGDVWYWSAQYEQRRSRRLLAEQRAQGGSSDGGGGGGSGGGTTGIKAAAASTSGGKYEDQRDDQQEPAAKRARLDKHQQQQQQPAPPSASGGGTDEMPAAATAAAATATAEEGSNGARAACKLEGDVSAEPVPQLQQGDSSKHQGTAGAGGACVAAAGGVGGELKLRPFKVGPPPDKLQQLWDNIQKVYDAGCGVLPLPQQSQRAAGRLYEQLDAACSGWLRAARSLLESVSGWPDLLVSHVVVGHSQLVPLLAKLLLTRLDGCFGLTQVYSAAAVPKVAVFKRIKAKYGSRARYIVVGGGFEEEAAARLVQWPFVRITLSPAGTAAAGGKATGGAAADKAGDAAGGSGVPDGAPARRSSQGTPALDTAADGSDDGSAGAAEDDEGGAAVAPCGGGLPSVAPDALGSGGHTLLELTADQLKKLALSLQ